MFDGSQHTTLPISVGAQGLCNVESGTGGIPHGQVMDHGTIPMIRIRDWIRDIQHSQEYSLIKF